MLTEIMGHTVCPFFVNPTTERPVFMVRKQLQGCLWRRRFGRQDWGLLFLYRCFTVISEHGGILLESYSHLIDIFHAESWKLFYYR